MKILCLDQYFSTQEMPGSTRTFEMAQRLVQKGHEVHVVTSEREGKHGSRNRWYQTEERGIQVHWFPVPYSNKMLYRDRLRAFFTFAYLAAKRGAAIKGDVIYASSTPLTIALPAVYVSKINRVPMVFEVRDLWPEVPIAVGALKNPMAVKAAQWLEHFAYRNSKRIVALSPGMKDGIVATGYPKESVTVIPNCCHSQLFSRDDQRAWKLRQQYEWLQDRPLVIYTGTIGLINGIDYMARLAASVRSFDSDIRLLVLGTGREEDKVRRLAEELGVLNQNFFILPPVPKSEVPCWLCAADIATSFVIDIKLLWKNSANKFFDALAAGKPIAINHGGWLADILQGEGAGLVLEVNDIDMAAKRLVSAIHDKEWLIKAGSASRKLAEERYNCDNLAAQLESELIKAVNK